MRVHVAFTPAEAAGAPCRHRRGRPPGDVDDRAGARLRLRARLLLRRDRGGACTESASGRGAARRGAERREDRRLRRRRLAAGVPGRAAREDGHLLDHERDARDSRDRRPLGGVLLGSLLNLDAVAAAARGRGRTWRSSVPASTASSQSTTPTARGGSSSFSAESRRTRRRRRSRLLAPGQEIRTRASWPAPTARRASKRTSASARRWESWTSPRFSRMVDGAAEITKGESMKIATIGRGNVGGGLAKRWRSAGHE